MRILKATEELKSLLDGFVYKNNAVEFFKDINDNWVLPEAVKTLVHIQHYLSQMELIDSEIDPNLTQQARLKEKVKFRITELAYSGSKLKDYRAIDYTTEVQKLHAKREFNNQGFLTLVTWYKEPEFLNPVVQASITYTTDSSEPIPAAQSVISRTVTRKWYSENEDIHVTDEEGNVIQSVTFTNGYPDDSSFWKVTEKHYKTSIEKRKEGIRRRDNIIVQLGDALGYDLVSSGEMTVDQADENLSEFLKLHSSALAAYREGGKGLIYSDIQNDTVTTWLTQARKDLAVSKLKGL
jgi:hypothetical protein